MTAVSLPVSPLKHVGLTEEHGVKDAGWAALLIGLASAPQAAVSGFRSPYLIPDTATAALGILLAITILATAGRMDCRDTTPEILLAKKR